MDEEFAMRQEGLVIDHSKTEQLKMGYGTRVTTTGTEKTPFQFLKEGKEHEEVLHLLPNCEYQVILGYKFLRLTKTLTHYTAHMVKRAVAGFRYKLCYLGGSGPTFRGLLNDQLQYALADTGASVMIMDEETPQPTSSSVRTSLWTTTRTRSPSTLVILSTMMTRMTPDAS